MWNISLPDPPAKHGLSHDESTRNVGESMYSWLQLFIIMVTDDHYQGYSYSLSWLQLFIIMVTAIHYHGYR